MRTSILISAITLSAALALVSCSQADQTNTAPSAAAPSFADPSKLTATAPDTFRAVFDTTKGKFTIEVTRSLAPNN